jgi:tetratricopeptide (TPR) repeat protein
MARISWVRILTLLVGFTLLVVFFFPLLTLAAQRNMLALNLKQSIVETQWTDPAQVCTPLPPPTKLTLPDCSNLAECYLTKVFALRRREWDNVASSAFASDDALAVFVQGWGAWCKGDQTHAIEIWRLHTQVTEKKFSSAAEASLQQDAARTLREGEVAHAIAPSNKTHFLIARALDQLGETARARQAYQAALDSGEPTADMFGQFGDLEWRIHEYEAARLHLERAVTLDNLNWGYWHRYGNVLYELKDWAGAEQAFRHAVMLSPTNGHSYAGLASAQLQQGHFDDAQVTIQQTVQYNNDAKQKAGYLASFAAISVAAGDWKRVAEMYTQAVEYHPENSAFWGGLMQAYAKLGDCARLEATYAEYVRVQTAQGAPIFPAPPCVN